MRNIGLLLLWLFQQNALVSTTPKDETCEAATTAGTCQGSETTTRTPIRLGLEWFLNPDHLPLVIAKQTGIFESFGLDVDLITPTDHWEAEEEIIAGRLDVALTEPLHLAQDAAKGKPVLGFGRFFHTDGGVMYRTDQNISRPADMCGKTISYPGSPGPGGPAIVNTMVKADGKKDCPIESYKKHNGGFFHTDALESGEADLATLIFWNFEIPEARARGLPVSFFSLKDWGVPDFCQLVLMTTPTRFAQSPKTMRGLVLSLRQATSQIHQDPEGAKRIYREYLKAGDGWPPEAIQQQVLEATLEATLPAFPNDSMMSHDYYSRLMQWLIDTKQVEQTDADATTVSMYWTNEVSW